LTARAQSLCLGSILPSIAALFVNPAGVGAQIEGAAVMGATLALKSETHMHLVPRGYDVLPERAWESQECPPLRPPSSTRYMLRWESAYARCRSPNDW
jgi:hypothetical protein